MANLTPLEELKNREVATHVLIVAYDFSKTQKKEALKRLMAKCNELVLAHPTKQNFEEARRVLSNIQFYVMFSGSPELKEKYYELASIYGIEKR